MCGVKGLCIGLTQGLYVYRCIEGHRFIPASQGVSVYGFIYIYICIGFMQVSGYGVTDGYGGMQGICVQVLYRVLKYGSGREGCGYI